MIRPRSLHAGILSCLVAVATLSLTSRAWAVATIAAQSTATTITPANPTVTVPVTIARTSSEAVRAYSVTIRLSPELALATPVTSGNTGSITQGSFFSGFAPTSFNVIDHLDGSYQVDCAILGTSCGPTATSGTLFTVGVTSTSTTSCQGSISVVTSAVAPVSPRLRDCNNVQLAAVAGPAGTVPIDRNAPVITLNGSNPMTVECHGAFTDPGATATDACAGTVPVTTSGSVDTATPGSYTLTYQATDGFNPASATRTVNVVDSTPPSLSLTAPNGGELWIVGTTRNVTWTAADACGAVTVDLRYSTDGGATYPNTIALGIANSGSYAWPVPDTPSSSARVRITAHDAAGNATTVSSAADFVISHLTPIADLTASRVTSGNDADGTTKIQLTWTATVTGSSVEIYRKGYGNYPTYAGGSVPAQPGADPPAGWTLAQTVSGVAGVLDEVACPGRDQYFYVAYVTGGGSVSGPSNVTGGTLNYELGDVTGAGACGDNLVNTADVSLLGAHYGAVSPGADYLAALDVGPTTTGGVDGRPLVDGRIEFEDLVMFALNYGSVSAPAVAGGSPGRASASAQDALSLAAPSSVSREATITAGLSLRGSGSLRAISTRLAWDPAVVRPVSSAAAPWLRSLGGVALSPRPGQVDAAALGGRSLEGEGELATVTFEVVAAGDPRIRIASVDGRDGSNHALAVDYPSPPSAPGTTALAAPRPNPFHGSSTIAFRVAREGEVTLGIYSVNGRRVRTLAGGTREPGEYRTTWDGRDDQGALVSPGIYYVRLRAGSTSDGQTLVVLR